VSAFPASCVYSLRAAKSERNVSFQANCIDSTAAAEAVFASEVNKLRAEKIKPREQITLEPFERDHAVVVGQYRWLLG